MSGSSRARPIARNAALRAPQLRAVSSKKRESEGSQRQFAPMTPSSERFTSNARERVGVARTRSA